MDSPTGAGPTAIVSGAFAAGTLDLIVANFADNTISVLVPNVSATTNKPDGTFTRPFTIATGTGPIAMVSADFNGDSSPDLAVAAQTGNVLSIILNSANARSHNADHANSLSRFAVRRHRPESESHAANSFRLRSYSATFI